MRNAKVNMITQAAIIAALYVVLTMFANMLGLAKFSIQIRFSEALCILPFFTVAAVPGLYVGCFIANIMTGACIWDIIFGSLATLIAALGSYALRKHTYAVMIPPVLANVVIVPFILRYGYGISWIYKGRDYALIYHGITVGIGEIISVCILGGILLKVLLPYKNIIFKNNEMKMS